MSHELRTPLAIIQGQVRLLKRKLQSQISSVDREQVFEILEKNLDRLIEIQRETDKIIRSSQESEGGFFLQELDRFWSKLEDISEISPGMKTQWNALKGWITKYLSGGLVSFETHFPFSLGRADIGENKGDAHPIGTSIFNWKQQQTFLCSWTLESLKRFWKAF